MEPHEPDKLKRPPSGETNKTSINVDDGWIMMKSKSHVGHFFLHNTLTGETVWNISEAKIRGNGIPLVKIIERKESESSVPQNTNKNNVTKNIVVQNKQMTQSEKSQQQTKKPNVVQQDDNIAMPSNPFYWSSNRHPVYGLPFPAVLPEHMNPNAPTYIVPNGLKTNTVVADQMIPKAPTFVVPDPIIPKTPTYVMPPILPQTAVSGVLINPKQSGKPLSQRFQNNVEKKVTENKSLLLNRHSFKNYAKYPSYDLRVRLMKKRKLNNSSEEAETNESIEPVVFNNQLLKTPIEIVNKTDDDNLKRKIIEPHDELQENIEEVDMAATETIYKNCFDNEYDIGLAENNLQFTNNNDSSTEKEPWNDVRMAKIDIAPVQVLCKINDSKTWYIFADTNVFMANLNFLIVFSNSHKICRLVLSRYLLKELEFLVFSERDSSSQACARRAYQHLLHQIDVGAAVFAESLVSNILQYDIGCPLGDDFLLNSCFCLKRAGYQYSFFTNDKVLITKSRFAQLSVFSINEIKQCVADQLDVDNLDDVYLGNLMEKYSGHKETLKRQDFIKSTEVVSDKQNLIVSVNIDSNRKQTLKPIEILPKRQTATGSTNMVSDKQPKQNLFQSKEIVYDKHVKFINSKSTTTITSVQKRQNPLNSKYVVPDKQLKLINSRNTVSIAASDAINRVSDSQHKLLNCNGIVSERLTSLKSTNLVSDYDLKPSNFKVIVPDKQNLLNSTDSASNKHQQTCKLNNVRVKNDLKQTENSKKNISVSSELSNEKPKHNQTISLNAVKSKDASDKLEPGNDISKENEIIWGFSSKTKSTGNTNQKLKMNTRAMKILNNVDLKSSPEKVIYDNDDIFLFDITDEMMESNLRTRCEEWVSHFDQIMVDILSQILQHHQNAAKNIHIPPPWTITEATNCIKTIFRYNEDISKAATAFINLLMKHSDMRGMICKELTPDEFMKIYSYGVNLLDSIESNLTDIDDVEGAQRSLAQLLDNIKDGNSEASQVVELESCTGDNNTNRNEKENCINDEEIVRSESTDVLPDSGNQIIAPMENSTKPTVTFIKNIDIDNLKNNNNNILLSNAKSKCSTKVSGIDEYDNISKSNNINNVSCDGNISKTSGINSSQVVGKSLKDSSDHLNEKDQDEEKNIADENKKHGPRILRKFKVCPKLEEKLKESSNLYDVDEEDNFYYDGNSDVMFSEINDNNSYQDYDNVDCNGEENYEDDSVNNYMDYNYSGSENNYNQHFMDNNLESCGKNNPMEPDDIEADNSVEYLQMEPEQQQKSKEYLESSSKDNFGTDTDLTQHEKSSLNNKQSNGNPEVGLQTGNNESVPKYMTKALLREIKNVFCEIHAFCENIQENIEDLPKNPKKEEIKEKVHSSDVVLKRLMVNFDCILKRKNQTAEENNADDEKYRETIQRCKEQGAILLEALSYIASELN